MCKEYSDLNTFMWININDCRDSVKNQINEDELVRYLDNGHKYYRYEIDDTLFGYIRDDYSNNISLLYTTEDLDLHSYIVFLTNKLGSSSLEDTEGFTEGQVNELKNLSLEERLSEGFIYVAALRSSCSVYDIVPNMPLYIN